MRQLHQISLMKETHVCVARLWGEIRVHYLMTADLLNEQMRVNVRLGSLKL